MKAENCPTVEPLLKPFVKTDASIKHEEIFFTPIGIEAENADNRCQPCGQIELASSNF